MYSHFARGKLHFTLARYSYFPRTVEWRGNHGMDGGMAWESWNGMGMVEWHGNGGMVWNDT